MNYILEFILSNVSGGTVTALVLAVLSFFEFTKIKLNPISFILSKVGNMINKTLLTEMEKLGNKLDELYFDFEDHKIESQRAEILIFANEAMRGQKHTKEEFDHILKVYDDYENYINNHKRQNGQVDMAYKYISEIYSKCLRENGFL